MPGWNGDGRLSTGWNRFCSTEMEHFGARCTKLARNLLKMERETGLEPATSSLGSWHSTAELLPLVGRSVTYNKYKSLAYLPSVYSVHSVYKKPIVRLENGQQNGQHASGRTYGFSGWHALQHGMSIAQVKGPGGRRQNPRPQVADFW